MKDKDIKGLLKWLPVVIAIAMSAVGEISSKVEQDRIDDMDERISKLENKNDGEA